MCNYRPSVINGESEAQYPLLPKPNLFQVHSHVPCIHDIDIHTRITGKIYLSTCLLTDQENVGKLFTQSVGVGEQNSFPWALSFKNEIKKINKKVNFFIRIKY